MSQKLKKLRFPGVLKIFESIETDHSLIIATERICPLYQVVQELSEDTKLWGTWYGFAHVVSYYRQWQLHSWEHQLGSILINPSGEWGCWWYGGDYSE
jgi:SCY1-like protein 1